MRIAHLSDSHFSEKHRLGDIIQVHHELVDKAKDAGVELFLHAGDWYHARSTPLERLAVAAFLEEAAAIAPVVGVKGNHDAPEDLRIFERIRSENPIMIFERPGQIDFGDASILAVPWFDRAHLVAELEATADSERTRNLTIQAAERMLVGLAAQARDAREEGRVPLLVGHVLVAGSETGTGFIPIGTTVELTPWSIAETGVAYAALGHVHKAQSWCDERVAYSGSPHRIDHGEPEAKGFRLITIEGGQLISNEFVELGARQMVHLEASFSDEPNGWPKEAAEIDRMLANLPQGARVRFRYRVKAGQLHEVDGARIERIIRDAGAADVQMEAVIEHEARVRSAEIVTATTTFDKVRAYWNAKQITLDDATVERVRQKLSTIETREVAHEAA